MEYLFDSDERDGGGPGDDFDGNVGIGATGGDKPDPDDGGDGGSDDQLSGSDDFDSNVGIGATGGDKPQPDDSGDGKDEDDNVGPGLTGGGDD